jgi:hypothetical protein
VTFKGRRAALPQAARPTKTVRGDGSMEFAGQKIDFGYMPAAHTDSDLYIHLPAMNLLAGERVSGRVAAARLPQRCGWAGARALSIRGHRRPRHAWCPRTAA